MHGTNAASAGDHGSHNNIVAPVKATGHRAVCLECVTCTQTPSEAKSGCLECVTQNSEWNKSRHLKQFSCTTIRDLWCPPPKGEITTAHRRTCASRGYLLPRAYGPGRAQSGSGENIMQLSFLKELIKVFSGTGYGPGSIE